MDTTIWLNGRFLARPVSGVERVAHELISAVAVHLEGQGVWTSPQGRRLRFRLIVPRRSNAVSPWPEIDIRRSGRGGGHVWEQTCLPAATRGEWLVSLCNTGPMLKRRQVFFLHDAQTFAIPDNFTWQFRLWYRLLFSVAGRMSRAIMTNSRYSRDELVRRVGLDAGRITPVWLGMEHVLREPPDFTIFERHPIPEEHYLLAVASASPNKNFKAILRALELLGNDAPRCVIAGQHNPRVFGRAGTDTGRVTHVGRVSDAELYALYLRARCLLFPSFYEGFGLPPVEAMALGCPAIVSRTSVMPEICGEAAIYCDPADPATLAAAIRRLQEEPSLHESLRARGRERARLFSWSNGGRLLLDILGRMAGKE